MVAKTATKEKAIKLGITRLTIVAAYGKNFSTGSQGFFGQAIDPDSGKRYQITGAVEIGSKPQPVVKAK